MSDTVSRLAAPLPDSVLDRYYAANPTEVDPREKADRSDRRMPYDDFHDQPEEQHS